MHIRGSVSSNWKRSISCNRRLAFMFTLPGKMRLGAFCGHGSFIVGQIVSENIYSYLYTMTMKMTIASVTITHSQISFLLFFLIAFTR